MTLVWLLSFVASAAVVNPETAVVGIRVAGKYRTIAFLSAGSGGYEAVSVRGLIAQTDAGVMVVDVVPDCRALPNGFVFGWHYLSIAPTAAIPRPVPCMTSNWGDGMSVVEVRFVGRRYITVERSMEASAGRPPNQPTLITRRWSDGIDIPMGAIMPEGLLAAIDRSVDAYREEAIASALRSGSPRDANPCWYGNASRHAWGIVRADRRWVVRTMLVPRCQADAHSTTVPVFPHSTTVPVPDEVVDGMTNEKASVKLSKGEVVDDVLLSPDGCLAVVVEASAVTLRPVDGGVAGDPLAGFPLAGWQPTEKGGNDAVVMAEWLDRTALSRWREVIDRSLRNGS